MRLSPEILSALLPAGVTAHVLDSVDSTSSELARLASDGAPDRTLVMAASQTGGRGRRGRPFYSPGGGAYFSLLLRTEPSDELSAYLTAAAALSAAESCEALFGAPAGIKWVNDVLVHGKKAVGILAEAFSDNGFYIVLGIGANLAPPPGGFPPELPHAGALTAEMPELGRERFAAETIRRLLGYIDCNDRPALVEKYRARTDMSGKRVTVTRGSESFEAVAIEIDNALRLVVRRPDGTTERLSYGEVSLHNEN